MLPRLCYRCDSPVDIKDPDTWVDVDENVVVCGDCKRGVDHDYPGTYFVRTADVETEDLPQ